MGPKVRGIVFDTTASNTGLHQGACVRIEEILGLEFAWFACRHHVMEVMLSHVFISIFGSTGGPETGLFKRFQKAWSNVKQDAYVAAPDDILADPMMGKLLQDMLHYLPRALEVQQPRDDYQECLRLSLIFLGGGSGDEKFHAPGPTHHARWMAKGIYALKLYLFREQFKLTKRESKNIKDLALFVSLVYIKYWNEAPLGIQAPQNDIKLLCVLKTYPNRTIGTKALSAFANHLWFLSECMVAFALFDDHVDTETKQNMVNNLQHPQFPDNPRRFKITGEVQM